jgi:hypothetical protein
MNQTKMILHGEEYKVMFYHIKKTSTKCVIHNKTRKYISWSNVNETAGDVYDRQIGEMIAFNKCVAKYSRDQFNNMDRAITKRCTVTTDTVVSLTNRCLKKWTTESGVSSCNECWDNAQIESGVSPCSAFYNNAGE